MVSTSLSRAKKQKSISLNPRFPRSPAAPESPEPAKPPRAPEHVAADRDRLPVDAAHGRGAVQLPPDPRGVVGRLSRAFDAFGECVE